MKNCLVIDTSSKYLTVLCSKEGKTEITHLADCNLTHSLKLMDAVEHTLIKAQLSLDDIDFFGCVVGPGSFTGIRIGIATIKGFCFAKNKPCLSLTSFDIIAYNANEKALAVIDAGHNNYYVCGFDEDKNIIYQPEFCSYEKLVEVSKDFEVYSFDTLKISYKTVDVSKGLLNATACKEGELSNELVAFYIKKSQAEESRLKNEG